jgi:hypothetical protein
MPPSITSTPKQVSFAVSTHCDVSAKTDKRNNFGKKKNRKLTGVRSKFILEGIRQELYHLQRENEKLRKIVKTRIHPSDVAEQILLECEYPPVDIFLRSSILTEEEETTVGEQQEEQKSKDVIKGKRVPGKPKSLTRIGERTSSIPVNAPIKELFIPENRKPSRGKSFGHRFKMDRNRLEFDIDKDKEQCLVDALTGEFAF